MAEKKPLTISVGEVLWDVLPDGKVLGGSPTNVAWHAAQLGADAHVVSAVGKDPLGDEILDILGGMKLNIDFVAVLAGRPTSTVEVCLDQDGNASYVFREDVAWDRLPVTPEIIALAGKADAVNFGSLSQRHPESHANTLAILDAIKPEAIRIFDINLRFPFVYKEVLDAGLRRASVVKMNEEELPAVAKMFGWTERAEDAIVQLLAAYPNLRHAVVTRAADGAWWHDRKRLIAMQPPRPIQVADTIGGGDSVTAAVMMGLLKGWDEEKTLAAALEIASFVCSCRGGTPELPDSLKAPFLS